MRWRKGENVVADCGSAKGEFGLTRAFLSRRPRTFAVCDPCDVPIECWVPCTANVLVEAPCPPSPHIGHWRLVLRRTGSAARNTAHIHQ